jgi:hypothetical protein
VISKALFLILLNALPSVSTRGAYKQPMPTSNETNKQTNKQTSFSLSSLSSLSSSSLLSSLSSYSPLWVFEINFLLAIDDCKNLILSVGKMADDVSSFAT